MRLRRFCLLFIICVALICLAPHLKQYRSAPLTLYLILFCIETSLHPRDHTVYRVIIMQKARMQQYFPPLYGSLKVFTFGNSSFIFPNAPSETGNTDLQSNVALFYIPFSLGVIATSQKLFPLVRKDNFVLVATWVALETIVLSEKNSFIFRESVSQYSGL